MKVILSDNSITLDWGFVYWADDAHYTVERHIEMQFQYPERIQIVRLSCNNK